MSIKQGWSLEHNLETAVTATDTDDAEMSCENAFSVNGPPCTPWRRHSLSRCRVFSRTTLMPRLHWVTDCNAAEFTWNSIVYNVTLCPLHTS